MLSKGLGCKCLQPHNLWINHPTSFPVLWICWINHRVIFRIGLSSRSKVSRRGLKKNGPFLSVDPISIHSLIQQIHLRTSCAIWCPDLPATASQFSLTIINCPDTRLVAIPWILVSVVSACIWDPAEIFREFLVIKSAKHGKCCLEPFWRRFHQSYQWDTDSLIVTSRRIRVRLNVNLPIRKLNSRLHTHFRVSWNLKKPCKSVNNLPARWIMSSCDGNNRSMTVKRGAIFLKYSHQVFDPREFRIWSKAGLYEVYRKCKNYYGQECRKYPKWIDCKRTLLLHSVGLNPR